MSHSTKLSILNLVPVRQGQSNKDAIDSMVALAKFADQIGYHRYWIAEHHNTRSLVSSATQVLIGHTLSQTDRIRVGSGGVMLPNHSPLMVAEQYGTLATIYPNRVDLGLGRAPGTDPKTAAALRRHAHDISHQFPQDIADLQRYFGDEAVQGDVKAIPAIGTQVPLYILGSSTDSAYLAAKLGLPYAFASHFAPRLMPEALHIYRTNFKPSDVLDVPYVIIGCNAIIADTDREAQYLATTQQQSFLNVVRGRGQPMQPPVDDMNAIWLPHEKAAVMHMTACSFVGGRDTVQEQLQAFQVRYQADELMVMSHIFDENLQQNSYQMLYDIVQDLNQSAV